MVNCLFISYFLSSLKRILFLEFSICLLWKPPICLSVSAEAKHMWLLVQKNPHNNSTFGAVIEDRAGKFADFSQYF